MQTKGFDSIRHTTGTTRRKSETVVHQIEMIEDDVKYSLASGLWDRRENDRLKQEDCMIKRQDQPISDSGRGRELTEQSHRRSIAYCAR